MLIQLKNTSQAFQVSAFGILKTKRLLKSQADQMLYLFTYTACKEENMVPTILKINFN